MARNLYILEELKSLDAHQLCGNINLPYTVPNGYWEDLENWCSMIHQSAPNMDLNISTSQAYAVPDGYFDTFAPQMLSILKGEGVAGLSKAMPFDVPEQYFDQQINNLTSFYFGTHNVASELNAISDLPHHNTLPYTVPNQYFETLPQVILDQVMVSEEDELEAAPLLASLKGSNPFEAPSFDIEIPTPIVAPAAAKDNVIAFEPKKSQNSWWKKATAGIAAAVVIGLGINTMNSTDVNTDAVALVNNNHELAADSILNTLSGESIAQYIAMNDEDFVFTYQSMQEDEARIHAEMDALLDNMNDYEVEELINNL